MRQAFLWLAVAALMLSACKDPPKAVKPAPSASVPAPPPLQTAARSGVEKVQPATDAGKSACRLHQVMQLDPGPARFSVMEAKLELFVNRNGSVERDTVRLSPLDAPALAREQKEIDPKPLSLPCGVTKEYVFCMNREGNILRTSRTAAEGPHKQIAASRAGATIAAAQMGEHTVVAFLAERKTKEGPVTEAWAVLDDGPPVRVSEDGAGATYVDVATRGAGVVFAYIDARSAMTPVHARPATEKDGKLQVGKDAVVFVGGAPDSRVAGVLAVSNDAAFFVMPMAKDIASFGMAIIKLDDPPIIDEPVTWSMYPNGIDPAPIAATREGSPIRLVRVYPSTNAPSGPRVVELGEIDSAGGFRSLGEIAEPLSALYVDVAVDRFGGVWTQHGDSASSTLERRRCP